MALFVILLLVLAACTSSDGEKSGAADGGDDGSETSASDASVDVLPRNLKNGELCAVSAECGGGCCELHPGNMTVCAQITPFDTSQNCACAEDPECTAVKLCGQPGFCQMSNEVLKQRFCSHVCK